MTQTSIISSQQLINQLIQMFFLQTIARIKKAYKINQERKFLNMKIYRVATSRKMK